ncbi:MAG TPA: cytochrome c [Steroidobacteraceae bacterium]|nr:cytochrome c [Steroidobacteraceae bacterium]
MSRLRTAMMAACAVLGLQLAEGAMAASAPDGKSLYRERCGMCHQTIGMAVGILSRRPGDESQGFLEERKDLSATFVRTVVRTGIANMPRMPRGEVSDAELEAIAAYLAKGRP